MITRQPILSLLRHQQPQQFLRKQMIFRSEFSFLRLSTIIKSAAYSSLSRSAPVTSSKLLQLPPYKNRQLSFQKYFQIGHQTISQKGFHSSTRNSQQSNLPSNSPWRIFVETFKSELKKSNELQESVKALQDSTRSLSESDNFKRAQEVYNKARDVGEQAGGVGTKVLSKSAKGVGKSVSFVWRSAPVRLFRFVIAKCFHLATVATAPIRNSRWYKQIRDVVDDGSSSRYGGYTDKTNRKLARERLHSTVKEQRQQRAKIEANQDAGEHLVLHKDSAWKESWNNFKDQSKLLQRINRLQKDYDESEHPIVASIRDLQYKVSDTFSSLSSENETAKVVRVFQDMDPSFMVENFLRELREYVLPEVVDAYVVGDGETLKVWLSEAPFSVWQAGTKEYIEQGLVPSGRVLDIRGVDIHSARILSPNEIPVLVVSFRTQEAQTFKNAKSGEIVAGREDNIQQVTYAAVFTRIEADMSNPETHGWRIIEFARARTVNYY